MYVKPKVRLSRAGDSDYSLKLRCDFVVLFVSQAIVEGVNKIKLAKTLTIKTWYLGRVYKMHCKIGNMWIDY
jgi:hypothetical protein